MLHVLKLHNIRYSCRWLFHVQFKRDKKTAHCKKTDRGKAGQVSLEGVVGQLRPQISQLYQSCMCISACTKRELMQVAPRYTLGTQAKQVSLGGVVGQLRLHASPLYQSCMCISACT